MAEKGFTPGSLGLMQLGGGLGHGCRFRMSLTNPAFAANFGQRPAETQLAKGVVYPQATKLPLMAWQCGLAWMRRTYWEDWCQTGASQLSRWSFRPMSFWAHV